MYSLKNFLPTEYAAYLCSVSGGKKEESVAKQLTSDAIKYLVNTPEDPSKTSWKDYFLDIHQLHTYIDSLQEGPEPLAAGTVKEKIRRLRLHRVHRNFK